MSIDLVALKLLVPAFFWLWSFVIFECYEKCLPFKTVNKFEWKEQENHIVVKLNSLKFVQFSTTKYLRQSNQQLKYFGRLVSRLLMSWSLTKRCSTQWSLNHYEITFAILNNWDFSLISSYQQLLTSRFFRKKQILNFQYFLFEQ